ncbi:ABC transporter substrate-binding protein [Microbacterium sp.]|uniref:ABC transporter substrate-binding protein n=1 Tax=Microbacterium sp. TaxID=51671 RepID=UPI0039E59244
MSILSPRRTAAVAAALATALALAGCAGTTDDAPPSDQDVVFTFSGLPTAWDPVSNSNGLGSLAVIRSVYEGLVDQVPGSYDVEPSLATEWTVSDDKLEYTFTLRDGVEFSDGTPFDAAAVVYNFERIEALGGQVAGILSNVSDVVAVDDGTVRLTLAQPQIQFLEALSFAVFASPTAAKENEADGDWGAAWLAQNSAGTGPYVVGDKVEGQSLELDRNEDYWGGWEDGQIDTVRFVTTPDATTVVQQLLRGEVDHVSGIMYPLVDYLDQLEDSDEVTVYRAEGTQIDQIQLNTQRAPLDNKLVRQAIQLAYDYESALQAAYKGEGVVPSGGLPAGYPGFDTSLRPLSQDLDRAKELLAESGETIDKLTLYYYEPLAFEKAESLILQDSLAELGIDLEVTATTWDQMVEAQSSPETAPDFNNLWHGPITADPADYLGSYFHSKFIGGYNWSFFDDAEFDGLIDEAQFAADEATRDAALAQAQAILLDEAPAIFAAVPNRVEVINSRFTGYEVHPVDYGGDIFFYDLRVAD